ncbi:MAG: KpsF/GutQ family sugar-phosphate isomerase [Gemmatimonadota bacterium]
MIDVLESARRTLALESQSIQAAAEHLDERFVQAVAILAAAERVIVSGIGKSGAIAQKIAGTLTSTGTLATWLHPVESLHGDLGVVTRSTAAIILSKSGETDELFGMLAALARMDVPIIALTGEPTSTLGRAAAVVLDASVREEACPHGLAPTSSTTVALALGDALAVALLQQKGFGPEDFAALHPGGRLGRRLLLRVGDVMVPADRLLPSSASMREVVISLAHCRGLALLVDDGQLAGVISAGDLTRLIETTDAYLTLPAADVMTRQPHVLATDDLGATAVGRMERAGIVAAPVLDGTGRVVGVVHLHDLLRAGAA